MTKQKENTAIFVAYEEETSRDPALPEKNLLRAVLLNALNDLRKNGVYAKKAIEYFLSPEEDYVFSFRSVCNYLDIDMKRILRSTGITELGDDEFNAEAELAVRQVIEKARESHIP